MPIAQDIYRVVCEYLRAAGWERTEPGFGWWWCPEEGEEAQLGVALEEQLYADGVDLREEPV